MATGKLSQKVIKQMVKDGAAVEIKNLAKKPKPSDLKRIGFSKGVYGINGALFLGKNGKMYAITSRSSLLFAYL